MNKLPMNSTLMSTLWNQVGFEPNDHQREAIQHVDGPLFLPAGPGSGKTRVLLWRTLNLIVNYNIAPEEIFLSTFTEKAALQLRDGLRTMLSYVTKQTGIYYDISRMYIGTVHSLCHKLLSDRKLFKDRHRNKPPMLLDELDQYLFIRKNDRWRKIQKDSGLILDGNKTINKIFAKNSISRHNAISNLIGFFNRLSEEIIAPDQAIKIVKNKDLKLLLRLYASYLQQLSTDNGIELTDLSLLQQKAVELILNNGNSSSLFKHVIVDEYQDTNTVQEKLFFQLAKNNGNICVVGDDDQALYRFRGATVENFVEFPSRCKEYLGTEPKKIHLNTNYRSLKPIVTFYKDFMQNPYCDWRKPGGKGFYRITDKQIEATRNENGSAVIVSTAAKPEDVTEEIANLVKKILVAKKVEDPNQIAFLFPSLSSPHVERMRSALEIRGLKVYAPRAGSFLDVAESRDIFGLFFHILGKQQHYHTKFNEWISEVYSKANNLIKADLQLRQYIEIRKTEIDQVIKDYNALEIMVKRNGWDWVEPYDPDKMSDILSSSKNLSTRARNGVRSPYFNKIARVKLQKNQPFSLRYAVTRASSVDWNVLDIFYQFCGFKHFKDMFDAAEQNVQDEGPICNMGLISQYLARFIDEYSTIISGSFLKDDVFQLAFTNYLYILYRRGEAEYEDAEDPFPKGRIPFITIHQSKGLEFPVVVLANPNKNDKKPQPIETMVQPLLQRDGEPLDRMTKFDVMRMFYVALSRAKNLLVIAHYRVQGQSTYQPFKELLNDLPKIHDFDVSSMPVSKVDNEHLPQTYSYTGDYLFYRKCPRQYMIFKKYGFVPSRSQTMMFGSLVHQTLEDLHQRLISARSRV